MYPEPFGDALADAYTEWRYDTFTNSMITEPAIHELRLACPYFEDWQHPALRPIDPWEDAEMHKIASYLGVGESPMYYPWETPCTRCMA